MERNAALPLKEGDAANNGGGRVSLLVDADSASAHQRQQFREFLINDANVARGFVDNMIRTSKYRFIPTSPHFVLWKNLFEQFHKAANLYFLLISALQLIPGLSPTGSYTTLIPLCLVLILTMLKDTLEDLRRHNSDKEVNERNVLVWRSGNWSPVRWQDLRVGELCKILPSEPFPADLLLLYSTEPSGECNIETASLDGETNLKKRQTPRSFLKEPYFQLPDFPNSAQGTIRCELPNNRLETFTGTFDATASGFQRPVVSLDQGNVLLRGATLRNQDYIIGAVIFTGIDTKLMKNSSANPPRKFSHADGVTNWQVLYIFIIQLVTVLGCAMASVALMGDLLTQWYLSVFTKPEAATYFFSRFATFLILFNNLIPISLYVTMEMVRAIQTIFVNNDMEMYYEPSDTPANCKTSGLNEELGQVEFVFSDKTGTLTQNIMEFLKFTCSKYDAISKRDIVVSYGTGITEVGRAAALRSGKIIKDDRPDWWLASKPEFQFYDSRINNFEWARQENSRQIEFFFKFLAVCHAVVPEMKQHPVTGVSAVQYQAASPDEACLVRAAKNVGVEFVSRVGDTVTIRVRGTPESWRVLHTVEFDSTRKRMTVVVEDPKQRILVLCKGADSVVLDRLQNDEITQRLVGDTKDHLTRFAGEGLRTLVCGMRVLSPDEFMHWNGRLIEANSKINDRAAFVEKVVDEVECELELIGTTAIEDKLQEGVPQTIELLSSAGVKVWILTGDKMETAVNIGFACALLDTEMGVFTFNNCKTEADITPVLQTYLADAKLVTQQDLGLIIEGSQLSLVLPTDDEVSRAADENARSSNNATVGICDRISSALKGSVSEAYGSEGVTKVSLKRPAELFLSLATRCKAVVCCRVSPLQKAQVVNLVRNNMNSVTLAIGDGANDVSMIQAAHVGVGISGLEGLQAARAADYSIGQFRFLQRLLLFHGRYNYRRVVRLILYCFYKNSSLYLTQLWFCIFNYATGQSLYDPWALSMYNVAFTAFPIVVLAAFDKDVRGERLLSKDQFPELYHDGLFHQLYNTATFWMYIGNAVVHSLLNFFMCVRIMQYALTTSGQDLGLAAAGCVTFSAVLLTVTMKVGLEMQIWNWIGVVVVTCSLGLWYVFLGLYGNLFSVVKIKDFAPWYGVPAMVLKQPLYWLTIVAVCAVALIRDFAWKVWRHNFNQKLMHCVQELEHSERPFSRKNVLRFKPHLLPKFKLLKPYEANVKMYSSVFVDDVAMVPKLSMLAVATSAASAATVAAEAVKSAASKAVAAGGDIRDSKAMVAATGRASPRRGFFAPPGKVRIDEIVVDDLL